MGHGPQALRKGVFSEQLSPSYEIQLRRWSRGGLPAEAEARVMRRLLVTLLQRSSSLDSEVVVAVDVAAVAVVVVVVVVVEVAAADLAAASLDILVVVAAAVAADVVAAAAVAAAVAAVAVAVAVVAAVAAAVVVLACIWSCTNRRTHWENETTTGPNTPDARVQSILCTSREKSRAALGFDLRDKFGTPVSLLMLH